MNRINYSYRLAILCMITGILFQVFVVGLNRTLIYNTSNQQFYRFIFVILTGVLLAGLMYIICYWWSQSTLKSVSGVLTKVKEGELSERINIHPKDQLGETFQQINQMIDMLEKAEEKMMTDYLTQIGNRRAFMKFFEFDVPKLSSKDIYAIYMDIDNFKEINDTLGHRIGDMVLERVGNILGTKLSNKEVGYRLSGDEFIILAVLDRNESIEEYIEKLNDLFNQTIFVENHLMQISISCGVSQYVPNEPVHCLLDRADHLMYTIKKVKKNNK